MRTLLFLSALLLALVTHAHEATVSHIRFIQDGTDLYLDVTMPEDQLGLAGQSLSVSRSRLSMEEDASLRAYLFQHLWLKQGGTILHGDLTGLTRTWDQQAGQQVPVVRARLLYQVEEGELQLHSDLIVHQVASHRTYVTQVLGLSGGTEGSVSLGVLRLKHNDLTVTLAQPSVLAGMYSLFMSGIWHIIDGPDHLLFILCLIMAVPAISQGGNGSALAQALITITAFTFTHALSMALVSFGWVSPGLSWVEMAIALSLVIAGILLLVPQSGPDGPLLAAAFGVIHGLAFASSLVPLQLNSDELALALLSFIAGTETVQILMVLALVPVLMALRYSRFLDGVRILVALLTVLAGSVWLWERSHGNDLASILDTTLLQNVLLFSYGILACMALPGLAQLVSRENQE